MRGRGRGGLDESIPLFDVHIVIKIERKFSSAGSEQLFDDWLSKSNWK